MMVRLIKLLQIYESPFCNVCVCVCVNLDIFWLFDQFFCSELLSYYVLVFIE
jgi:hypothetical protein